MYVCLVCFNRLTLFRLLPADELNSKEQLSFGLTTRTGSKNNNILLRGGFCTRLYWKGSVREMFSWLVPQKSRGHNMTFNCVCVWAPLRLVSGCECRHRKLVLAGLHVSVWWDARLRWHSPLCRVRRPPDKTPRGSVPVGVRPFSCKTLSFSSLPDTHTHTYTLWKCINDPEINGLLPPHSDRQRTVAQELQIMCFWPFAGLKITRDTFWYKMCSSLKGQIILTHFHRIKRGHM